MITRFLRPLVSARRRAINLVLDERSKIQESGKAIPPWLSARPEREAVIRAKAVQAAQLLLDIERLLDEGDRG